MKKKNVRPTSPVEEMRAEKLADLKKDFAELESYKKNKHTLQYTTFFVPGWTGEDCGAWKSFPSKEELKGIWRYKEFYRPVKLWIEDIFGNSTQAHYITFTDKDSRRSPSFKELGRILKGEIIKKAGKSPVNLVGHSMGGLDIRAAILDDKGPKLNIKNVITVGTPNNGVTASGILELKIAREVMGKFGKKEEHHVKQCHNMATNGRYIKELNTAQNRKKLLEAIDAFYVLMGLRDPVAGNSPKLKKDCIPAELYKEKVRLYQVPSAEHSGKDSITQDPRMVFRIIRVLCGDPLIEKGNKGYIHKKT